MRSAKAMCWPSLSPPSACSRRAMIAANQEHVASLQHRHADAPAADILAVALRQAFPGRIAVVSSFGAESPVLLHLVASIDPSSPLLFVDTGRHFPATLAYRDAVTARRGRLCLR